MPIDSRVILVTCPDAETGQKLARVLVEEKLAACVNIVPGLTSVYFWQGAVQTEAEVLLLIKSTQPVLARLQARLLELHPYTVPEFLSLPVDSGAPAYLQWLAENVR